MYSVFKIVFWTYELFEIDRRGRLLCGASVVESTDDLLEDGDDDVVEGIGHVRADRRIAHPTDLAGDADGSEGTSALLCSAPEVDALRLRQAS